MLQVWSFAAQKMDVQSISRKSSSPLDVGKKQSVSSMQGQLHAEPSNRQSDVHLSVPVHPFVPPYAASQSLLSRSAPSHSSPCSMTPLPHVPDPGGVGVAPGAGVGVGPPVGAEKNESGSVGLAMKVQSSGEQGAASQRSAP